jgi:hypothetical protein
VVYQVDAEGDLAEDRFNALVLAFNEYVTGKQLTHVYVEGLPFVKSRKGIVGLASILGAVQAICALNDVTCTVVPGYRWKRALSTGTTKERVSDWVSSQGVELETQDLRDAYAIARYGQLCG